MDDVSEDEWQRDTPHPSSRALRRFIESDIQHGLGFLAELGDEGDSAALMVRIERAHAEISRLLAVAAKRRVALGPALTAQVIRFQAAVDAIRRRNTPVQ